MKKIFFLLLTTLPLITHSLNQQTKLIVYKQHINSVEGWFAPQFIDFMVKLNDLQQQKNITGNLAEIGVYRGRSFIPLYLLSNTNERVLAVDCFDDQQFNYDNSGPGCKLDSFKENIKKFCDPELTKLDILQGDSGLFTSQDFLNSCNNGCSFRIFSVDGCHRTKETLIDTQNAAAVLSKGGLLIIDDYFRADYPGVSEAVAKFLISNDTIKPFFIGFNKIILTHQEFAKEYRNHLKLYYVPFKEETFFDSTVSIYLSEQ